VDPDNFPFLVVGNKSDLEQERCVSGEAVKRFCQANGRMDFVETSAKTNAQVEEAFKMLTRKAMYRQEELHRQSAESMRNSRPQGTALRHQAHSSTHSECKC